MVNITFMIGNGFDLACGLKSRYQDMYTAYLKEASDIPCICKFKEALDENYDNWSDFEMAIPEIANIIGNFGDFRTCIIEFTRFLKDYLETQQNSLTIPTETENLEKALVSFLCNTDEFCLHESKKTLNRVLRQHTDYYYNFLTFNYTNTLEVLLGLLEDPFNHITSPSGTVNWQSTINNLIHIHSSLDLDILLGLDNMQQYENIAFSDDTTIEQLSYLIDKNIINQRTTDNKGFAENIIATSNVIVIFGWSMGDSDFSWLTMLQNWFTLNTGCHLVYAPFFERKSSTLLRDELLLREDRSKADLCKLLEIDKEDYSRVHIALKDGFMNFESLLTTQRQPSLTSNST